MMTIRELTDKASMLEQIEILQHLYPRITPDAYAEMLDNMLPHNYGQVAVFDDDTCIAICGYWLGTKLWCGKYLELDNVVVHADHRSKGAGNMISAYLEAKAEQVGCTILVLDAYTTNFKAHRFYYNQGFGVKGFHFVKVLNKDGIT